MARRNAIERGRGGAWDGAWAAGGAGMKPRLFKSRSLWYCLGSSGPRLGIGYTPAQAYEDWAYLYGVSA